MLIAKCRKGSGRPRGRRGSRGSKGGKEIVQNLILAKGISSVSHGDSLKDCSKGEM